MYGSSFRILRKYLPISSGDLAEYFKKVSNVSCEIFIFGFSAGWWGGSVGGALERYLGSDIVEIFIMIIVFGVIISFITGGTHDKEDALAKLGVNFKELFGGKK